MANIERSYHDVTMLDKATALAKVKDVMDISSGTEFFTIVKDPDSIKPTCAKITYVEGKTNFQDYIKPHQHYSFKGPVVSQDNLVGTNTKFGMRVKINKMEFVNPLTNQSNFRDSQWDEDWITDLDKIMHHCKTMWLIKTSGTYYLYFMPFFRDKFGSGDSVTDVRAYTQSFASVSSGWHMRVPISNVRLIEFDVFEVHPDSVIDAADKNLIFNLINRAPSVDDYADVVLLTQSPYNRFSISVRSLTEDRVVELRKALEYFELYDGYIANKTFLHNFVKTYWTNTYNANSAQFTNNYEKHLDPGPLRFGGRVFFVDDNNKFWRERLKSGETVMLFTDLNHHAATFMKIVLSFTNIVSAENIQIHTHSTKQLFRDISLRGITHSRYDELIIGNGDNWNDASYVSKGIRFVEDINLDKHKITNCDRITTTNITSTGSSSLGTVAVSNTLSVTNAATFNNNVTVGGTLTVSSNFKISDIGTKDGNTGNNTGGSLGGLAFVVTAPSGSDKGVFKKTNIVFDTTNNSSTVLDYSSYPSMDYTKHKVLAIDGQWQVISPSYVGAADLLHKHKNITNDGKITTNTSPANGFKLVMTNAANEVVQTSLALDLNSGIATRKKYLSQYGEFNSLRDLFFHARHNTTNGDTLFYDDGSIKDLNNANEVGIYRFRKMSSNGTANVPGADTNDLTSDSSTSTDRYKSSAFANDTYGICLVLTSNGYTGEVYDTNAANGYLQHLVQIAFTGAPYANAPYTNMYIRNKSYAKNSTGSSWSKWITLSQFGHNHNRLYAALSEAKIQTSVTLHSNVAGVGNYTDNSATYYRVTYNADAAQGDTVKNVLYSSITDANKESVISFVINNKNGTNDNLNILALYRKKGGDRRARFQADVEINGGLKFTDGSLVSTYANNYTPSATQYVVLADVDGNNATIKRSPITEADLYSLSGVSSNVQTQLNNKLSLSGGTMTGNISYQTSNYTSTPLSVYDDGTTYGHTLVMEAGGTVYIGAGESASALRGALGVNSTERLYLSADDTIVFATNCQTVGNRKTMTYDTSGNLAVPGTISEGGELLSNKYAGKGVASSSAAGLMSATDKANFDTLWGAYAADADGLSDQLAEIKNLFADYSGTTTIVNMFATKVNTSDVSSAGNAAQNKVVSRNAAGSIQSEKFAVSSGTTTKATMQYNSSEDCIEFIFA